MRPFVRGERWRERQPEEGDGQVLARLSFGNFGGKVGKNGGKKSEKAKCVAAACRLLLPPAPHCTVTI